MRIDTDPKLDFNDVLIRPKRSTLRSRSEVDLNRTFVFPHTRKTWTGVPIIAANMDTVGTTKMAIALAEFGCMTALHKHHSIENFVKFRAMQTDVVLNNFFYSIGILDQDIEQYRAIVQLTKEHHEEYLDDRPLYLPTKVCIDVANGYSEGFVEFIKRFRDEFPDAIIMAGNVVTGEMTEELILSGVDIVKVGIGPGSVCTTRKMTGVGYPQLSAIIECADAAHGVKGLVCADGGCTVPGDIAKAFGAGADFVMLGGMLSGHDECDGEYVYDNKQNRIAMKFYGMSSKTAQEKHNGGLKEYRASEGKCVEVPYKGAVADTMKEILGGLRSACTYVGAERLKELSKRTTFIMVQRQLNEVFGKS